MSHFLKRFSYAWHGIWVAVSEQSNFKIHFGVAFVAIGAGIYFGINGTEWILIAFAIGSVISAEMFNTAIEYIVNMVSPDRHPMAGKIKDIAAGAVLVVSIMSVVVGIVIFGKYLFP